MTYDQRKGDVSLLSGARSGPCSPGRMGGPKNGRKSESQDRWKDGELEFSTEIGVRNHDDTGSEPRTLRGSF